MTNAEIIELAKERFKEIYDFEGTQRREMEDDLYFAKVDQWDKDVRAGRSVDGFERPCLTIPRLDQYLDYVNNQQRQNRPAIKVAPIDDGAQEKHAKNRQGLMKNIQYKSKSDLAHQIMFENATNMGRGHCIVNTEYVSPSSFDQEIVVDPVPDPLRIFMDARRTRPDYSDCKFGFYLESMSKKQFDKEYKGKHPSPWESVDMDDIWVSTGDVVIVQYWCLEEVRDELLLIETEVDGQLIQVKKLKSEIDGKVSDDMILNRRKVKRPQWMWYKMTGQDILEKRELLCKEIPIITMVGKEGTYKGEWYCYGLTRRMKDSCRMYNYVSSTEIEYLDTYSKAPYIGAVGQFEGLEDEWAESNITPTPFLRYHPTDIQGTPVPPPQRNTPPAPNSAHIQQKQEIIQDMNAISGLNQASFGMQTNETSGVAIRERKLEGDNASYHFNDNFGYALTHEGRVMNHMLDKVYDVDRVISIMGEDDEVQTMKLGEKYKGEEFSLGDGDFSVIVELGPSYATMRQESTAAMIESARYIPAIGQASPDLIIKQMDWPMKDDIADRTKKFLEATMPPGITSPRMDEKDEKAAMAMQIQQAQQAAQQMQQQMQQMAQQLEALNQEKIKAESMKAQNEQQKLQLQNKQIDLEAQIKAREIDIKAESVKVDAMKVDLQEDTKLQIAGMNNQSTDERVLLQEQLKAESETKRLQAEIQKAQMQIDANNRQLVENDHQEYRDTTKKEMDGIKESIANINIEPKTETKVESSGPEQINVNVVMEPQKAGKKTIKKTSEGNYEVLPGDDK